MLLLLDAPETQQQLHVPHIGRLSVADVVTERGTTQLFAQMGELLQRHPGSPNFPGKGRRPHAHRLGQSPHPGDFRFEFVMRSGQEERFEGNDLPIDKLSGGGEEIREGRRNGH